MDTSLNQNQSILCTLIFLLNMHFKQDLKNSASFKDPHDLACSSDELKSLWALKR